MGNSLSLYIKLARADNKAKRRWTRRQRTQRGEEPSVLAAGVALLQHLLDSLLRILPLGNLLEGLARDGALETFQLEGVARRHQVVVVDHLDEGLDLGSLLLAALGHAARDLGGVALDAGDDSVAERMRLVAIVDGLDDDDLELETVSKNCSCLVTKKQNKGGCVFRIPSSGSVTFRIDNVQCVLVPSIFSLKLVCMLIISSSSSFASSKFPLSIYTPLFCSG